MRVEEFLTKEKMRETKIGIGDEVFIPSLFTFAPGTTRNLPILRHGNIAMLPESDERMMTSRGLAEVYLIEARSIAGVSGAPVFVRGTVGLPWNQTGNPQPEMIMGLSSSIYLLGLMHAHWDIRESEINNPKFMNDSLRGVNLGIAVVVPASKIIELLQHPGLLALIQANEHRLQAEISPTQDKA